MLNYFDSDNVAHDYTYDADGNLLTDTATHPDGTSWTKTYTWVAGKLTHETAWVQNP